MISTTADGYARSAVVADPATYGNNVRLSIDAKFQAALEQAQTNGAMSKEHPMPMTAGVVMDIHTGDVLAISSHPTFDPNLFVPSIDADGWNALNTGQYNPLLDRSIHAEYPPGSQFKTVTSIAAMRAGVFDPNWVVHCTGGFDIGKRAHGPQERARRRDLPRGPDPLVQHLLHHARPQGRARHPARHGAQPEPWQPDADQAARRIARLHSRRGIGPARAWPRFRRR